MLIKNKASLISHGNRAGRSVVLDIIEAGLAAPDPYNNTRKLLQLENEKLIVGHPDYSEIPGQGAVEFDLGDLLRDVATEPVSEQTEMISLRDQIAHRQLAGLPEADNTGHINITSRESGEVVIRSASLYHCSSNTRNLPV